MPGDPGSCSASVAAASAPWAARRSCCDAAMHGRTHQRVAKADARIEVEQPGRRRWSFPPRRPGAEQGRRPAIPSPRRPADPRPRQQERLRRPGQLGRAPLEALADPHGQRQRRRQPEADRGKPTRRQPARQLEQRQRVAARLGEDPLADTFVKRPGRHQARKQRARASSSASPSTDSSGSPASSSVTVRVANSKLCGRPAAGAREPASARTRDRATGRRPRCTAVKLLVGGIAGQQAQRGQADEESLRRRSTVRPSAARSASR